MKKKFEFELDTSVWVSPVVGVDLQDRTLLFAFLCFSLFIEY